MYKACTLLIPKLLLTPTFWISFLHKNPMSLAYIIIKKKKDAKSF